MLSENTLVIIESTIPVLEKNGEALVHHFYQRMLSHQPELKHLFNATHQETGQQAKALASAVLAYAKHIRHLEVLAPAVMRIAHKHTSVNVRPEHYPIVGKHLLASLQEILNLPTDHEIIQAWGIAYQQLAELLISTEAQLYEKAANQAGGWSSFRPFRIEKKEQESEEIVSLYLYPTDGGPVPDFQPGQYVSLKSQLNGIVQLRQYSLSDAPNRGYLRLSIKDESKQSTRVTRVSGWVHSSLQPGNIVELTPPFGHFTLVESETNSPIVFISAGIGQTPLLSMLSHLLFKQSQRPIHWVHAARHPRVHAFGQQIQHWCTQYPQLQSTFFYEERPDNLTYHSHKGKITAHHITQFLQPEANYYLCGPTAFMVEQHQHLNNQGVPPTHIHYEVFGSDHLGL
jgi:nitric oxide dioxygenase